MRNLKKNLCLQIIIGFIIWLSMIEIQRNSHHLTLLEKFELLKSGTAPIDESELSFPTTVLRRRSFERNLTELGI